MTRTFTTYEDAMTAVHMIELFALRNGMRIPQHTIAYFNGAYVVTQD